MRQRYTMDVIQTLAKARNSVCLSTEYVPRQHLEWQCTICFYTWKCELDGLKRNKLWCNRCSNRMFIANRSNRRIRYTIEEIYVLAKSKNGKCLSTEYKHNREPLRWKCNICCYIWDTALKNIHKSNNGTWCPNCARRPIVTILIAKKLAIQRDGKCLSTEYVNNKTNLKWQCNKCEHIWEYRFDRVNSGTWCPNCNMSRGERIISEYLKKHHIVFMSQWQIPTNTRMKMDFYIPSIKTAIEFDGIQHFEVTPVFTPTLEKLHKNQARDIFKTKYCLTTSTRLIRIAYNDLKNIEVFLDKHLFCIHHKYILSSPQLYNYLLIQKNITDIGE